MVEIYNSAWELSTLETENIHLIDRDLTGYAVMIFITGPIEPSDLPVTEDPAQIKREYFASWQQAGDQASIYFYLLAPIGTSKYIALIRQDTRIMDWAIVTIGTATFPHTSRNIWLNAFGCSINGVSVRDILTSGRITVRFVREFAVGYHRNLEQEFLQLPDASSFNAVRIRRKKLQHRNDLRALIDQCRTARRQCPDTTSELLYWKERELKDRLRGLTGELFPFDDVEHIDLERIWFAHVRDRIVKDEIEFLGWGKPVLLSMDYRHESIEAGCINANEYFLAVEEHWAGSIEDADSAYELSLFRCHSPIETTELTPFLGLTGNALSQSCEVIDTISIAINDTPLEMPILGESKNPMSDSEWFNRNFPRATKSWKVTVNFFVAVVTIVIVSLVFRALSFRLLAQIATGIAVALFVPTALSFVWMRVSENKERSELRSRHAKFRSTFEERRKKKRAELAEEYRRACSFFDPVDRERLKIRERFIDRLRYLRAKESNEWMGFREQNSIPSSPKVLYKSHDEEQAELEELFPTEITQSQEEQYPSR